MSGSAKETYFSVDIEASGPVPSLYSMLALGACSVGDPTSTFYAEIKPISRRVDGAAMKVVGKPLSDFLREGREPGSVMRTFRRWIIKTSNGKQPVFVGFNATFDWAFVNWYFRAYRVSNPFGPGGVDIKSYYMGFAGCSWEKTRSRYVAKRLGLQEIHSHNALQDALEQGEVFAKLLKFRVKHP